MADELQIMKNRFRELSQRAQSRGTYFYSDFLNLYEQSILENEIKWGYTLEGGFPDAERKLACFGLENDFGYSPKAPISIVCISPLSEKFSDDLSHRDFLGSLMGLGIKRETLGDIVINGNRAYLICLQGIADYVIENLTKVRHTSVSCKICDSIPLQDMPQPQEKLIIVSSLRLDALIAGVYNLSRSKSSALISGEKVFINGKLTISSSLNLNENDLVSVRGMGRFKFLGSVGDTRKGRLRIKAAVY